METLQEIIAHYSQKYVEAVELEMAERDIPFVVDFELIMDIKVRQLTPLLFTQLRLAKNPLVTGSEVTPANILSLLWLLKIKEPDDDSTKFFEHVIQNYNLDDLVVKIIDYFNDAFGDSPGSSDNKQSVPYFSNLTTMVDLIASEYHWDEDKILNMPYKRLLQYAKYIQYKHDPKKILFNKSDSINGEMMRAIGELTSRK